jgi:ribonuclease HI
MKTVICYTDGGSRGNPGPGAIGVYITDAAGVMVREVAQTIGNCTNNFAEYNAVLVGLQTLKAILGGASKTTMVEMRLDSELVKKQLNAEYQIKEPGLVPMFIEIHNMRVASFPHILFTHVPRAENKEADRLVNEALDAQ